MGPGQNELRSKKEEEERKKKGGGFDCHNRKKKKQTNKVAVGSQILILSQVHSNMCCYSLDLLA